MAGSIYRERSLRDPQHDGQRGGVAALQGERRLGRRNLSLRWIFRPSAGLLAGFSIHPDGKRALTSISKWPIGSGSWRGSSSGRRTGCAAAASLSETCARRTSGRTTLRWKVRAGGVGVGNAFYAKPEKRERVLLYWRKRNEDLRAEGRYDTVQRWAQIKTRYGLTKEQYDDLLLKQNNACAICKAPFTDTPCVDHDHVTNIK